MNTEELLTEAKARLADIAFGAQMMLQVLPAGAQARYAREVLRVAGAPLESREIAEVQS